MEATVRATCPQCSNALRIPAEWLGRAVKCKKCGAMVRTKAKANDDTPPNGLAPAAPVPTPPAAAPAPQPQAQANAFDFNDPASEGDGSLPWLPSAPAPAPAPVPAPAAPPPAPQLDANGFPLPPGSYPYPPAPGYGPPPGYPMPPGYPYAPPPGYPYPMPPGYGPPPGYPAAGAPAAPGYPYPMPPGYPPPAQHGYAPPPGYGFPPAAPMAPVPAAPVPAAPAQAAPSPFQPAKPGAAAKAPAPNAPASPNGKAPPKPAAVAPVPPSNEFKMDSQEAPAPRTGRGRPYRRSKGTSKFVWIGVCFVLTAGLVAGGIFAMKYAGDKVGSTETADGKDGKDGKGTTEPKDGKGTTPGGGTNPKAANNGFPRRLLFISITKYMYLNPLTQAQQGAPDRTKPAALRLAFDWRVPTDPNNNQVFVLSDTVTGAENRLPMKNVLEGTYAEFFKTSRAQDRIVVYFGGHAIEKDGKAYIAPMEAELDGEDWQNSVIALDTFYAEMQKCKAAQKVVIWDVCRFNPEKGRVRPGSEPMTEALHKALSAPPAGVQALVTCKPGENALEFTALRPDGFAGQVYSGSSFLESMKFVAEPRNARMPKTTPTPADPLPVAVWAEAISKRTTEMSAMAEKSGSGGKQTVALAGTAPANLPAPNPAEAVAARFEMPQAPKGASPLEIKNVEREFNLPPMKPGLGEIGLADFPFPADVMKPYEDKDAPSIDTILKEKEKYPLRAAVVEALQKVRDKWTPGTGITRIRNSVEGPINDKLKNEIKKEQEDWALGIIELELKLTTLEGVAAMRESEGKRWQAHYDFALASVKARLAYMNEYNKLLGNLITETLPTLDPKLGHDGYTLIAAEELKSGKDVKKMATEAQALFQKITVDYKGTPWAIQAKQEKSVQIGLNWKPASLKGEPMP